LKLFVKLLLTPPPPPQVKEYEKKFVRMLGKDGLDLHRLDIERIVWALNNVDHTRAGWLLAKSDAESRLEATQLRRSEVEKDLDGCRNDHLDIEDLKKSSQREYDVRPLEL
jgi:hypothetical protein